MFDAIAEIISRILCVLALHLQQSSFPKPLSEKEEERCILLSANGDRAARDRLIRHNLRLVAHIVKKYYARNMEPDDLISIGTVGLIKAVDSFRPSSGTRFATYASRCIENELLMTFRASKKEQNVVIVGDGGNEECSLLELIADDCDIAGAVETRELAKRIQPLLEQLPARERAVIELRYGIGGKRPLTQSETAERLCISRSYISRIEKHALSFLRKRLS